MGTWEIVTFRKPMLTSSCFTLVDIGFQGVTIPHVTLLCSQYLYNMQSLNYEICISGK